MFGLFGLTLRRNTERNTVRGPNLGFDANIVLNLQAPVLNVTASGAFNCRSGSDGWRQGKSIDIIPCLLRSPCHAEVGASECGISISNLFYLLCGSRIVWKFSVMCRLMTRVTRPLGPVDAVCSPRRPSRIWPWTLFTKRSSRKIPKHFFSRYCLFCLTHEVPCETMVTKALRFVQFTGA